MRCAGNDAKRSDARQVIANNRIFTGNQRTARAQFDENPLPIQTGQNPYRRLNDCLGIDGKAGANVVRSELRQAGLCKKLIAPSRNACSRILASRRSVMKMIG